MDATLFNATDCTLKGTAKEYLTLFQFDPDAPCSGHGVCQSGVCICESGWHGESDMVNLSGYACHVQDITRQIFWGIVLLLWTVAWGITAAALKHKYGEWKSINGMDSSRLKSSGKQSASTYFPFQFLVPSVFVVIPLVLALALLKIFTTQAIGVDMPVTLCFMFASIGAFFVSAHSNGHQFKMLTGGRMLNSIRLAKIVSQFTNGAHISQVVYVLAKLLQVGAIGAQGSGPLSAPVVGLLLANNFLSVLYFAMYALMAHYVMKSVAALLASQSGGSTGAGVSKSQLAKVLSFMELTVKQSRKAIVFASLVYFTITLPWFFGYQTFAYALAFVMAFPTYSKQARMFLKSNNNNNNNNNAQAMTIGSVFNTAGSTNQHGFGSNQNGLASVRDNGEDGSTFEMHSDGRVLSAKGSFTDMDSMAMDDTLKFESRNPSYIDENNEEMNSRKLSRAQIAARVYNTDW